MKLVTSVYRRPYLLSQFLNHYSKLGVDEFVIGVFGDQANREWIRRECKSYIHRVFEFGESYNAERDTLARLAASRLVVEPTEWWVIADLDEFHEYPAPLPDLTKLLDQHCYSYLRSYFVDRIAMGGVCPILDPPVPIWEQFPAAANITTEWMHAPNSKVMLIRGHGKVNGGHHNPTGGGRVRVAGRVHHFKWFGDIEQTMIALRERRLLNCQDPLCQDRFLWRWQRLRRFPIEGECGYWVPPKPDHWPSFGAV